MTEDEAARVADARSRRPRDSAMNGPMRTRCPTRCTRGLEAIDDRTRCAGRPSAYRSTPEDMAMAGAFVSLDRDGSVRVERGFVKPEDQLQAGASATTARRGRATRTRSTGSDGEPVKAQDDAEECRRSGRAAPAPRPSRLGSHGLAHPRAAGQGRARPGARLRRRSPRPRAGLFLRASAANAVSRSRRTGSPFPTPRVICAIARPHRRSTRARRHGRSVCRSRTRKCGSFLLTLDGEEQSQASRRIACRSASTPVPKSFPNMTMAASRRMASSDGSPTAISLALAAGLDVHGAGWRPTAAGYFSGVTKPQILADVAEARGDEAARMIGHLKKADMARAGRAAGQRDDSAPGADANAGYGRHRSGRR